MTDIFDTCSAVIGALLMLGSAVVMACGLWQARDARNRTLEQDREEWRAIKWILLATIVFGTIAGAITQ